MRLFLDLVFPLTFVLLPAVTTLFIRHRGDDAARRAKAFRLALALWTATAVIGIAVIVLWATGRGEYSHWGWFVFFPLWFGLAMPLAVARNPDWGRRSMPSARAARVTPRNDPSPASWPVLAITVAMVIALFAATVTMLLRAERSHWWLLAIPCAGGCWLVVAWFMQRRGYREPEPLPASPAPELERAYDEFRQWMRKTFFWFGIAGAMVFATGGFVSALAVQGALPVGFAAFVGGGLGAAFGIAGSVVGLAGTHKRTKINRLYREAVEASSPI